MSAATVHRRVRTGLWERLYPAVYLVGGHRLTDEARVRAAWLLAGEQAAVSGQAAAYWHGLLDRAPAEVEVTVPRRNGPGCRPGALVRRRDLLAADLVRIRDVWLTDVPLTVLETAVALRDGSVFLDRALQRRVRFSTVYPRSVPNRAGAVRQRPGASWSPRPTAQTRPPSGSWCASCAMPASPAGSSATPSGRGSARAMRARRPEVARIDRSRAHALLLLLPGAGGGERSRARVCGVARNE